MKAFLIFFILSITAFTINAQEKYLDKNNETQLWGTVSIENLIDSPFAAWYQESIKNYQVITDKTVAGNLRDVEVLIYLGTWCSDSQDWVPKFIKTWETNGLDLRNITMIALHNDDDKYKQSPQRTELKYNIEYVPTFIFLKNGKELGRIVEYPQISLLEDIKRIVR